MSKFIDGSKHAFGTAEIESHFSSNNTPHTPGQGAWKTAAPFGAASWNPDLAPTGSEDGLQNRTPAGASGASLYQTPGISMPRETGVNYKPAKNAGHTNTADPFSPLANGFPDV